MLPRKLMISEITLRKQTLWCIIEDGENVTSRQPIDSDILS